MESQPPSVLHALQCPTLSASKGSAMGNCLSESDPRSQACRVPGHGHLPALGLSLLPASSDGPGRSGSAFPVRASPHRQGQAVCSAAFGELPVRCPHPSCSWHVRGGGRHGDALSCHRPPTESGYCLLLSSQHFSLDNWTHLHLVYLFIGTDSLRTSQCFLAVLFWPCPFHLAEFLHKVVISTWNAFIPFSFSSVNPLWTFTMW